MLRFRTSIVATFIALSASPLAGQVCAGTAPFAAGPLHVGGALRFGDNLSIIEADAVAGPKRAGAFAGAGVRRRSYAGAAFMIYAGQLGYSVPLAWRGRVELCPVASVDIGAPSSFEIGVGLPEETMKSHSANLGVGIGTKLVESPTMDLVPFVSATLNWNAQTIEYGGSSSTTRDRTYTLVAGMGFVLQRNTTIRPLLTLPFRGSVATPNYGVAVTWVIPPSTRQ